jgi:hypothetical protein
MNVSDLNLFLLSILVVSLTPTVSAAPPNCILIDGVFDDWANVPTNTDADAAANGSVPHTGTNIPDVHDTDHGGINDIPASRDHQDVDILEYKFTHDGNSLYAYFRADGVIGRTNIDGNNTACATTRAGRYYVIVTIDVDGEDLTDTTGYWLNEGGYFPTSRGYDINMELEFFDGAYNTGHYINHGAVDAGSLAQARLDQIAGVMDVLPGSYDWYTQWVWWDAWATPTPAESAACTDGPWTLPDGSQICFVSDRGPVFNGIVKYASSLDGTQLEMSAPFRGLMNNKGDGTPVIDYGSTLDISFSLEASGELSGSCDWASDTADPIIGYVIEAPPSIPTVSHNGTVALVLVLIAAGAVVLRSRTRAIA